MEINIKVNCYDNGCKSFDRFTVVLKEKIDGAFIFIGMSPNPTHPLGFGQSDQSSSRIDFPSSSHLGKRIEFEKLPVECQNFVQRALLELSVND